MTPKHQAVIDRTLHAVHERAHLMVRSLHSPEKEGPGPGDGAKHRSQEEQMEALRASTLGHQLRWIADYVEGYPAAKEPERKQRWAWSEEEIVIRGGMRREVYAVCAVVYGSAAEGNAWSYPRQCQHTDLGRLLHAALMQFYHEYLPADRLVSVGKAAKKIGIARQTLHEWMESGRAKWIYEAEHDVTGAHIMRAAREIARAVKLGLVALTWFPILGSCLRVRHIGGPALPVPSSVDAPPLRSPHTSPWCVLVATL